MMNPVMKTANVPIPISGVAESIGRLSERIECVEQQVSSLMQRLDSAMRRLPDQAPHGTGISEVAPLHSELVGRINDKTAHLNSISATLSHILENLEL